MKTPQTETYWLAAFAGSKWRKLGIVMVAGSDAPPEIRGKRIFYRQLTWGEDMFMRRDKSVGFSKPAFAYAVAEGVRYVVTYTKQNRQMNIAHVDAFTFEQNYGQGNQMRAYESDTKTITASDLRYPTALETRRVQDEEPVKGPEPLRGPAQQSLFGES